jgi:hypothetical protein
MTMSWNKGQRDLSSHVLCLERGFLLWAVLLYELFVVVSLEAKGVDSDQ